MPAAVILNDTSTRYHHGCARVMRLLTAGLENAGLTITRRIPARADWTRDAAALAALRAAQVIVINGEGTLHDGAPAGERLLSVLDAAPGVPVALVNALWENNPPAWDDALRRMALVSARDSRSAAAMSAAAPTRWLPDLSLSAPANTAPTQRARPHRRRQRPPRPPPRPRPCGAKARRHLPAHQDAAPPRLAPRPRPRAPLARLQRRLVRPRPPFRHGP